MRFIITTQSGKDSKQPDPNAPLDEQLFNRYMNFNEEMHKAGVLVAAEGFKPDGKAARLENRGGKRAVVDGPFTEAKELIGGLYIIEVDSFDEAMQWALRCPTGLGFDDVMEIRQLTGGDDLPPEIIDLVTKAAPTWSKTFTKSRSRPRS